MKIARMVAILLIIVATVLVALGIFDALSWNEIKDSLGKTALLALVIVVASAAISLIGKGE